MRILDARDIWGVGSPEEMLAERTAKLARRGMAVILQGDGTPARGPTDVLDFYVSDGRWVGTCPACNGGTTYFPDCHWTVCPDCGKGYRVRFPAQKERIESCLMDRPIHNRQFLPGWRLEDLEAEIATFGLAHHSWTAPRTWVTSEFVTAAIGNTHWRDEFVYLKTTVDTGLNGLLPLRFQRKSISKVYSGTSPGETISVGWDTTFATLLGTMITVTSDGTGNDNQIKIFRDGGSTTVDAKIYLDWPDSTGTIVFEIWGWGS